MFGNGSPMMPEAKSNPVVIFFFFLKIVMYVITLVSWLLLAFLPSLLPQKKIFMRVHSCMYVHT